MKKTMLSIALAAVIGLGAFQVADARQGQGPGVGGPRVITEEALQAREAFRAETSELRKEIAVTRARLQAATNAGDQDAAARLTEELFELREQMQSKAQESGMRGGYGGRGGGVAGDCPMGRGMGPRR